MCLNLLRFFFQPGLVTAFAISLALGLSGCGKKAPLSLPDASLKPAHNGALSSAKLN